MSALVTYFDNLVTHLAGAVDGILAEITAKQVLLATGADDEDQLRAIDDHVKNVVMRTKGIGIVIFGESGTNQNADGYDGDMNALVSFEVRLFIHPQKWGSKYDPTKRKAREILEALIKRLNGAEILPFEHGCRNATVVESWVPVPDPEFWAWNVVCNRSLFLRQDD